MGELIEKKPQEYKCLIAIDERGDGFLISSNPSLYEFEIFDGNSLQDNINCRNDGEKIPKECGIYTCTIKVQSYKYYTDCGYEYDVNIWMENVIEQNYAPAK